MDPVSASSHNPLKHVLSIAADDDDDDDVYFHPSFLATGICMLCSEPKIYIPFLRTFGFSYTNMQNDNIPLANKKK